MPEELDYYLEAEPLTLFREHLAGYPTLLVPAPHRDLSATRELTMDRVIGTRIDIAANLPRLEMPFGKLGADLLRAYLEQIFVHGLIHADPHPGNVLLTDDGADAVRTLTLLAPVTSTVTPDGIVLRAK